MTNQGNSIRGVIAYGENGYYLTTEGKDYRIFPSDVRRLQLNPTMQGRIVSGELNNTPMGNNLKMGTVQFVEIGEA